MRLPKNGSIAFLDNAETGTFTGMATVGDDLYVGGNDEDLGDIYYDTSGGKHDLRIAEISKLTVQSTIITAAVPFVLPSYTVAALPAGLSTGAMAYCTNDAGGAVPVFYDGAAWRRVTDRTVAAA